MSLVAEYRKLVEDKAAKRKAETNKWLEEKQARGERTVYQIPSEKYVVYRRFDFENLDHREYARLHPKRVIDSEATGKLLKFLVPTEAEPIIERSLARCGRMPDGVIKRGDPPPTNLPEATLEDALIKKLGAVFSMATQALSKSTPQAVIASTLESLRQLQRLDGRFPQPLTEKSLCGIVGDFVELSYPTVVACREMLVYEMLPLLGVLLGDAYYVPFGADKHFPSLFALAIGRTTDGKGQAQNCCESAVEGVDPMWLTNNLHSNPSSGEGLIRMLSGGMKLEGGHKKRVAVFNSEMMTTFVAQGRKDSSLSGFLRKAYDAKQLENFRSEGKKSAVADNYLLGFVGTITPSELRDCMPLMDWKNGAQNRFLWTIGFKDKQLSRSTNRPDFKKWAERVKAILKLNESVQPTAITYSEDGAQAFDDWHQSLPVHDDSILADSQARVEANVVRVANLYAQLDERRFDGWQVQLERRHVEAGIEIVNRSRQSVEWYLTQQTGATKNATYEDVQKLRLAVLKNARETGDAKITATEVYHLFSNRTQEQRDAICLDAGFKTKTEKPARGKPVIVWVATE